MKANLSGSATSGDRIPGMTERSLTVMAEQRLLTPNEIDRLRQGDPSRRENPRPARQELPRLFQLIEKNLLEANPRNVVAKCMQYFGDLQPPGDDRRKFNARSLVSAFARNLLNEDDEAGCVATATLVGRLIDDGLMDLPPVSFLEKLGQRYVGSTAYLLPLLHRYSSAALAIGRQMGATQILSFLRDGLFFFPSLWAIRGTSNISIRDLIYTRPLKSRNVVPLCLNSGNEVASDIGFLERATDSVLLDVGLYGTLIQKLHDLNWFRNTTVFFVGSRNPHLPGFLNLSTDPAVAGVVSKYGPVKLVDTIETLLKPFQFRTRAFVSAPESIAIQVGDPLSLVCSTLLSQRLYRYALDGHTTNTEETTAQWILADEIPPWSERESFLQQWKVDSITPYDKVADWLRSWEKQNR